MHGMSPMKRMQGSSPNNVAGPVGSGNPDCFGGNPQGNDNGGQGDPDGTDPCPGGGGGGGNPEPEGRYFRAKADATAYPTLRSNKEFDTWYEAFIVIARAQGFYKVFDTEYVPMTAEYFAELLRMNRWIYAVLQNTVKTTNGKVIMKSHFHDADCFAILVELIQDAHASVAGSLDHVEVLHWLSSVQYSPRQGSAVDFVIKFDETITHYNDGHRDPSDKLSDSMQKLFLQRALHL
ncbi:hypothetical protein SEMRO_1821_G299750.1 [Seminavis robusta]|uniref:Uncharacterized protein n=1 Tax=Seminavis robusta TaxID=568900 RepID=A0A9N8HVK1_9STRA|nr:hypothetical protein SEMRO_1821_G299750.1 [Seminavis robusta]|eukprot:Sro1821_g299750.1 n/a (235) ;mRNA; f:5665-6446